MSYRWPCISYVKFSSDNFAAKHFLGVFDSEEKMPDGSSASYAACDEMERCGWVKLGHNHDLQKGDLVAQLRSNALTRADNITVDDSFVNLQPVSEIVGRLRELLARMGVPLS